MINFKKNITVGVSVSSERGLEVAQIDFATKTMLKYASRQLSFDNNRKEISDLDIFKETLQDVFNELQIPKGAEIVLSVPPAVFKVTDYPASLTESQIDSVIEEDLLEHYLFKEVEPAFAATKLPNSTIQFNKVVSAASPKIMLIEIALQIKEMGYSLIGIEPNINATLNSLVYNDRVNTNPDFNWVLLLVENSSCRIIPMQSRNYVESFEERISIGEVLGDEENYSTVVSAISPIIKNLPSQCLYIVSKTNVISAKVLAEKILYNGQIIHEESNYFVTEPFLELGPEVDPEMAKTASLDVVGAAISREFREFTTSDLNLFNETLGDVYLDEQPPVVVISGRKIVLSMQNMIKASILVAIPMLLIIFGLLYWVNGTIAGLQQKLDEAKFNISKIKRDLDAHGNISTEAFDEGDEVRIGIVYNKNIFTYYQIVGTEIPQKLWLTNLELGKYTTIEGQADNLESIYSFFRSIKDYNPKSAVKLQSLGLATTSKLTTLSKEGDFDTNSILTTMNADFYKFRISDAPIENKDVKKKGNNKNQALNELPELD